MNTRRALGCLVTSLFALVACSDDTGGTGGMSGTGGAGVGAGNQGGAAGTGGAGNGTTSTGGQTSTGGGTGTGGSAPDGIQTVFIITMENHSASSIIGSSSAPYINGTLAPMAARASNYKTPAGNHPSEPNYIWLEAGTNLGITNDNPPANNHKATTAHLSTQLEAANVSWKAYAEGIPGTNCPLTDVGLFSPKHTPQLFFDDVTDTNSASSQHCIDHVRPYSELAQDLSSANVARYNFITPDLCNDMHGEILGFTCNSLTTDVIKLGDTFLSQAVPMIMASSAYQNGGLIIVWWDEGDESLSGASDGPLPFFVVSANAKPGYVGSQPYTHSSTLRSLQEIFGVQPFLGDAATANDLSDLFSTFP